MSFSSFFSLVLRLKGVGSWDESLAFHSGFSAAELLPLILRFNSYLDKEAYFRSLTTIRAKYGHQVFFEVADVEPLAEQQLRDSNAS